MNACRAINGIGEKCQGRHGPDSDSHQSGNGNTWNDSATWDTNAALLFVERQVCIAKALGHGLSTKLTSGEYLDSDGRVWTITGLSAIRYSREERERLTYDVEFHRLDGHGRFEIALILTELQGVDESATVVP